jgi:O-methyltransferase
MKRLVKSALHRIGLDMVRTDRSAIQRTFGPEDADIIRRVQPYTATGPERVASLAAAVRYLVRACIPGAFVECGTWRGGSMMAVAYTLAELGEKERELYLYDTFEGMPPPGPHDIDHAGRSADAAFQQRQDGDDRADWYAAPLATVRRNMARTGYPERRIHFVQGRVEETVPGTAPESIALLRLDTDWYESTKHELVHLFPRLVSGGVLIIDDYGHWQGCRKAADEYFAEHGVHLLLHRVDYTAVIAVKP